MSCQSVERREKKRENVIMFNMPLFTKKPPKTTSPTQFDNNNLKNATTNGTILPTTAPIEKKLPLPPQIEPAIMKPQLVFHCQLAHGSPTGLITGFSSVKELYQKIAECYDFSVDEVSVIRQSLPLPPPPLIELANAFRTFSPFFTSHRSSRKPHQFT